MLRRKDDRREMSCLDKLILLIHHQQDGVHDWWRKEYFNVVKTCNHSDINSHQHLTFCKEAINFLLDLNTKYHLAQ